MSLCPSRDLQETTVLANLKTRFERNLIYVSLGLASTRTHLDSRLGVVRKMEEPVTLRATGERA